MGMIFEDALEDGVIKKNPAKSRKLVNPSSKKTVRKALEMEQVMEILSNQDKLDVNERRLMALLMFTGMRRGEALGLQWDDFSLAEGSIHIQRNVTYAKNQPSIGSLKSENGNRVVSLLKILWKLLDHNGRTGYIVGGDKPITLTKYRRIYENIAKKIYLHGATAHIFRHTFLTLLSNANVAPKIIQVIAGHADISTTMNTYTDGQIVEILKAGQALDGFFSTGHAA